MNGPGDVREPAVAGAFYPAAAAALEATVDAALAALPSAMPQPHFAGALVPHAGLVYSGAVAATGWRALLDPTAPTPTIVILGTNHSARFAGVAVFDGGAWRTPLGDVAVDAATAAELLALGPPFAADRAAHRREHAIEVQLPLVVRLRRDARIVPCSVSAGTGPPAVEAGRRLGERLAKLAAGGREVLLVISTDMAHYPPHAAAVAVTERLVPAITALEPLRLAEAEAAIAMSRAPGMACGMCGIQPTVLGLAALRAMGVTAGTVLAARTSADAGGDPQRTVGYLTVGFA